MYLSEKCAMMQFLIAMQPYQVLESCQNRELLHCREGGNIFAICFTDLEIEKKFTSSLVIFSNSNGIAY